MRILYVVPKDVYDTKMSRVRFQQIVWLDRELDSRVGSSQVRTTGPGWPDWQPSVHRVCEQLAQTGFPVEVIVTYGMLPLEPPLFDVNDRVSDQPPVVVQFNEADNHRTTEQAMSSVGASLAIFHHANDLQHYSHWDQRGITRVHIPHGADPDVYMDYGLEKDIDILCCGNMNSTYYPFRYRLMLLATRVLKKRGWKVVHLPHPGYTLPPRAGTVVGADFAKVLNRSKLVLTDSMCFRYQLAKYAEIACSRSLAVGDLPDECSACLEMLRDTVVQVEPWMLDESIQRTIEDLLDDTTGLLVRRTADAYDRGQKYMSMRSYAARFIDALTVFLTDTWPRRQRLFMDSAP